MLTVCHGSAGKATQIEARDFPEQARMFPKKVGTGGDRSSHLLGEAGSAGRPGGQLQHRCYVSLREKREEGASLGGKEPL